MKKYFLFFVLLPVLGACTDKMLYRDASTPAEERAADLLKRMTLEEKILQLTQYFVGENNDPNNAGEEAEDLPSGIGSLIYMPSSPVLANEIQRRAVEQTRLGIPVLFGFDVIHGYHTAFPIPLAQSCSWEPELVTRANAIAAREAYSAGIRWTFAPMVDIARDPRWGRVMEGYGEDPYTASVFCRAAVRGFQGEDLAAPGTIASCLKHYVGYGASEAGRDYVPTDFSRQALWDTYLQPFQAGVEEGVATVMSSFNTLSGIPATANHYTLTEVLKQQWNFSGFVVSDWDAVGQLINQGMAADRSEAARLALQAGVDMDMCDWVYRDELESLVRSGAVRERDIDASVLRILTLKFQLGLFENPYTEDRDEAERFMLPDAVETSRTLAEKSIVLLKNEGGILPLDPGARVALTGPLADRGEEMNGNWAAHAYGNPPVSIRDGMAKQFPLLSDRASDAITVVCCIGQNAFATGENCSYSTIDLPEEQEELVKKLKLAGKKVVVVLTNGRPLALSRIEPYADAIVETWHLGTFAGDAIASVLCGRTNPSGKLSITFPYTSGQIPIYYNRRHSARRGDQGIYKDITSDPLYPFGYGLSYSSFSYGPISVSATELSENQKIHASVTVTNTSSVDGEETLLWFIQDVASTVTRPVKELRFFEKAAIPAGGQREFVFEIDPLRDLGTVDEKGARYVEPGEFRIIAGAAADSPSLSIRLK